MPHLPHMLDTRTISWERLNAVKTRVISPKPVIDPDTGQPSWESVIGSRDNQSGRRHQSVFLICPCHRVAAPCHPDTETCHRMTVSMSLCHLSGLGTLGPPLSSQCHPLYIVTLSWQSGNFISGSISRRVLGRRTIRLWLSLCHCTHSLSTEYLIWITMIVTDWGYPYRKLYGFHIVFMASWTFPKLSYIDHTCWQL